MTDDVKMMRLKYFVFIKRNGILRWMLQCMLYRNCKSLQWNVTVLYLNSFVAIESTLQRLIDGLNIFH